MSTSTPPEDGSDNHRGWIRIAGVVVITLAVVYAVRFAGQTLDTRRADMTEHQMATEVADLEEEVIALETGAAEAASDAAVERWAREDQKWAREGDHVIVPVPDADGTLEAPRATPTPEEGDSVWSRIHSWITGEQSR